MILELLPSFKVFVGKTVFHAKLEKVVTFVTNRDENYRYTKNCKMVLLFNVGNDLSKNNSSGVSK
tara:strand:+ start:346 stop:540 length:195 start_codon:yes stop_codon:yes gene_type:complete